jgi:hypothetical protein
LSRQRKRDSDAQPKQHLLLLQSESEQELMTDATGSAVFDLFDCHRLGRFEQSQIKVNTKRRNRKAD